MGSIDNTKATSLTTALQTATAAYTAANPKSLSIHTAATQHLPGGNTRTVLHTPPFPLSIASAKSCRLTTADGAVLTDFLSEYTAAIYGHSHPVIKLALLEAVEKGWNYGAQCGLEGKLATEICSEERYGKGGMEMCRFVNSGTEANMMALSVASALTTDRDGGAGGEGREKQPRRLGVLMFDKGYHGSVLSGRLDTRTPPSDADADADATTNTTNKTSSTTAKPKLSLNLPFNIHVAPYNDIPGTTSLVRSLGPQTLAAILVEPMLGSGGCFAASPAFLRALRRLADETGALLVFDEVMTSRLGPHGFGYEVTQGDVKPDLMTLGKWVGGGSSFGAFGGRREIMELFDPKDGRLEHPGTFNNNVFTMRAGLAGLGVVTGQRLRELGELGERLRGKLDRVLAARGLGSGFVAAGGADGVELLARPLSDVEHEDSSVYKAYPRMFVKGVGSLLSVHFTGPDRMKWQQLLWLWMVERGYWIAARGFIALNIELTDQDVDGLVEAVDGFVGRYGDLLKW